MGPLACGGADWSAAAFGSGALTAIKNRVASIEARKTLSLRKDARRDGIWNHLSAAPVELYRCSEDLQEARARENVAKVEDEEYVLRVDWRE
jgi:hypothetical protein